MENEERKGLDLSKIYRVCSEYAERLAKSNRLEILANDAIARGKFGAASHILDMASRAMTQ